MPLQRHCATSLDTFVGTIVALLPRVTTYLKMLLQLWVACSSPAFGTSAVTNPSYVALTTMGKVVL